MPDVLVKPDAKFSLSNVKFLFEVLTQNNFIYNRKYNSIMMAYQRFLKNIFAEMPRNPAQERNLVSQIKSISGLMNHQHFLNNVFGEKSRISAYIELSKNLDFITDDILHGGVGHKQMLVDDGIEAYDFLEILNEIQDKKLFAQWEIYQNKILHEFDPGNLVKNNKALTSTINNIEIEFWQSGNLQHAINEFDGMTKHYLGKNPEKFIAEKKSEFCLRVADIMFAEKKYLKAAQAYSYALSFRKKLRASSSDVDIFNKFLNSLSNVALEFMASKSYVSASYFYQLMIRKLLTSNYQIDPAYLYRVKQCLMHSFEKSGMEAPDLKQKIIYLESAFYQATTYLGINASKFTSWIANLLGEAYYSYAIELRKDKKFSQASRQCELALDMLDCIDKNDPSYSNLQIATIEVLSCLSITLRCLVLDTVNTSPALSLHLQLFMLEKLTELQPVSQAPINNNEILILLILLNKYAANLTAKFRLQETVEIHQLSNEFTHKLFAEPEENIESFKEKLRKLPFFVNEINIYAARERLDGHIERLFRDLQKKSPHIFWNRDGMVARNKKEMLPIIPALGRVLKDKSVNNLGEVRKLLADHFISNPENRYKPWLQSVLLEINNILGDGVDQRVELADREVGVRSRL